jgi:hypothetical protein
MNIKRREKKEETKRCKLFNQMGKTGKQNLYNINTNTDIGHNNTDIQIFVIIEENKSDRIEALCCVL